MLVSTIVITTVAAGAVLAWRLLRGDDGDGPGSAGGEWDRIALVDRTTGAVTLVDDDGEVTAEVAGTGRVGAVHAHRDRLALVGLDQIALVGGSGGDTTVVPTERGPAVHPMTTDDSFHLVVGSATGGNVQIVDAVTGDVIDVGEQAGQTDPRIFPETVQQSNDGRRFALADSQLFQTIVVSTGGDDPWYAPDQPIALDGDTVATRQVIAREADITLWQFDDDGNRQNRATATVGIPAGGVLVDDRLIVVSVDGEMSSLRRDDDAAERLGVVAVPTGDTVQWVRPALDGDRLVVAGTTFVAVVDLEGTTVFTTTFADVVDALAPEPTWTCLPVGGDDQFHTLVSLDDGEQLADLRGLAVTGTSADGCTVLGERNGIGEVVNADGTVGLGPIRLAALGPDGRTIVRQPTSGSVELLVVDDLELGEPIDLGELAPVNLAVAFLDT